MKKGARKNRGKTDKSRNDAERDRPRRQERIRYDRERNREKEKARGGSKVVESEEPRCKGGKRREGGYSSIPLRFEWCACAIVI